jgi:serine protease Do
MNIRNIRRKNRTDGLFLVSAVLIFILAPVTAVAEKADTITSLRQIGKAFASIAEKASPAVVGIRTEIVLDDYPSMYESPFGFPSDPFEDDFFDHFFRRSPRRRYHQQQPRQVAQGSGFIISRDGYIMTNNHLVDGASKVTVKLTEDREVEAKIIGTDPDSDIAVVKIDEENLPYLELADSDAIEVGEWVIAIGSPFGLSHTVTAGIVSAKGRSRVGVAAYEDFIQTDAAINPGNSGGPLLNLEGEVVGINTAIISRSGGNMGIGLAIPVNMAKNIYNQLVDTGKVIRGFLGVGNQDLTPELAESFGLKDSKGVIITEIIQDSAAAKAGLRHNDVIVEFNGKPVERADTFRNSVAMLKPGTEVKLTVIRNGQRKTFTVELGERPRKDQVALGESGMLEDLGIKVQNLTEELARRFGYEDLNGVIVLEVNPGSLADLAGITAGTLIMEVDRKPVYNTKDFTEAIQKSAEDGSVLLLVNNGSYSRFLILKLQK